MADKTKLVRDTSTPENKAWWDAVHAAAAEAPAVRARIEAVTGGKTHWEGCERDTQHLHCAAHKVIEALETEAFGLAANQCHDSYGDQGGRHRCAYQDRIQELETYLRGFIWFLNEDVLIRNVGHRYGDDEGKYRQERERFVAWLKQAYKAAHEEDCMGVLVGEVDGS